jgi:hypothetical protein
MLGISILVLILLTNAERIELGIVLNTKTQYFEELGPSI